MRRQRSDVWRFRVCAARAPAVRGSSLSPHPHPSCFLRRGPCAIPHCTDSLRSLPQSTPSCCPRLLPLLSQCILASAPDQRSPTGQSLAGASSYVEQASHQPGSGQRHRNCSLLMRPRLPGLRRR
jgi:hypothetical protein